MSTWWRPDRLVVRAYLSARFRLFGQQNGYGLPVPPASLDREYESGHWDHFFSDDERPRYECVRELLNGFSRRPLHVLDVGCGSARLATLLEKDESIRYFGIDVSREGLTRARGLNLPRAEFEQADFECWQSERRFDVIVFNEVFGYSPHPAKLVRLYARMLTPDGFMIASYFRDGRQNAIWRVVTQHSHVVAESVVERGARIWDVKAFRPLPT